MGDFKWDALASALAGSGIAGVLIRAFISKSLESLDDAIKKIIDIKTELARITVKLENFEKSHDNLIRIDRKVAALEMKVYGEKRN